MKLSNNSKGALCIIGAFLLNLICINLSTFGNMSSYIASFLRFKTVNTWITVNDTVSILATLFIGMSLIMSFGGVIENIFGIRLSCFMGICLTSLCMFLNYFTIKTNLWLVMLTYGLGAGLGTGLCYSLSVITAMKWFPRHRGLISGIVTSGLSLGSVVFNPIQTLIINPFNISPASKNSSLRPIIDQEKYFFDEQVLNNIPKTFVILGVICTVLGSLGVILLIVPDETTLENLELLKTDDNKIKNILFSTNVKESIEQSSNSRDFSVSEAVRSRMFWLLWNTYFFNGITVIIIISVYKTFGQQFIREDLYFATLGSVCNACNCLGRLMWGRVFDAFNYRISMSFLSITMAVTIGTVYFCKFITNVAAVKVVYFIWWCILFAESAGLYCIIPAVSLQHYGNKNAATIYGLLFTALVFASLIAALISSFLIKLIHYYGLFIVAAASSIISLILTQFYRSET